MIMKKKGKKKPCPRSGKPINNPIPNKRKQPNKIMNK